MAGIKTIVGALFAGGVVLLVTGCTARYVVYSDPVVVDPGVVVIEPAPGWFPVRRSDARSYNIPAGHYPPPGSCRIWFPDRPAGQQPPPTSCNVRVPLGAVLIRG